MVGWFTRDHRRSTPEQGFRFGEMPPPKTGPASRMVPLTSRKRVHDAHLQWPSLKYRKPRKWEHIPCLRTRKKQLMQSLNVKLSDYYVGDRSNKTAEEIEAIGVKLSKCQRRLPHQFLIERGRQLQWGSIGGSKSSEAVQVNLVR